MSYSRRDVAFADELELALNDKGFDTLVDRHDITAGEEWQKRLSELIHQSDTLVFVLTETAAASPVCAWEVEEAARLGKRFLVVAPGRVPPTTKPPPQLAGVNWIHCWRNPDVPGSNYTRGVLDLEQALRVDMAWLRAQTRLSEQAAEWLRMRSDDLLLRGSALEEAINWRARTPSGGSVAAQVRDYLDASDAAEAKRKAEAQANLAEREAALAAKETALTDKQRADKARRLATWIGIATALLLGGIALWGNWHAINGARKAAEAHADTFADASAALAADGEGPKAILMALTADPAAKKASWAENTLWPGGYEEARFALANAVTSNRLERTLTRDAGEIHSVSYSPDGKHIAIVSGDTSDLAGIGNTAVKVYETATGRLERSFMSFDSERPSFSPDAQRLIIGNELWDVSTGKQLHKFDGSGGAFVPDGKKILTLNNGGIAVWDAETFVQITTIKDPEGLLLCALSIGGGRVMAGVSNAIPMAGEKRESPLAARIWDIDTGRNIMNLLGPNTCAATLSADGRFAVTSTDQNIATLWHIDDRHAVSKLAENESQRPGVTSQGHFMAIAVSTDGFRVATGLRNGVISFWDSYPGIRVGKVAPHASDIKALAFSPDGRHVVSGSENGAVEVWKVETGRILHFSSHSSRLWTSPDGRLTMTVEDGRKTVLRDVETMKELRSFQAPDHLNTIEGGPSAYDGSRVIAKTEDGHRVVWDTLTGKTADIPTQKSAALSPDGKLLALVSDVDDNQATILAADTRAVLQTVKVSEFSQGISSVSFTTNGKLLVTSLFSANVVWDVASGKRIREFSGSRFVLSADGRRAAAARGSLMDAELFVDVWDVTKERPTVTLRGYRGTINSLDLSSDGSMVLSTGSDRVVRLSDASTGRTLQTFEGFNSATFSADDKRVLARWGGEIVTIEIFDRKTPAADQVREACSMLADMGVTDFSRADYDRFRILRNEKPNPCVEDAKQAPALVKRAREYIARENPELAIADFDLALRIDPTNKEALLGRAEAHLEGRNTDIATKELSEIIAGDPKSAAAFLLRGRVKMQEKKFDAAIVDFSEAIKLDPKNAEGPRSRAEAYGELKQYERAIADYSEAIRLDGGDRKSFLARARAYAAGNDSANAIPDFSRAIELNPLHAARLAERQEGYVNSVGEKVADREWRELIGALKDRASEYENRSEWMRAAEDFDRLSGMNKYVHEWHNGRCRNRILAKTELDVARIACDEALKLSPEPKYYDSRGLLNLMQGRAREAWDDFNAAVERGDEDAHRRYGRGLAELRLGRTAEGNADLAAAKQIEPEIERTFAGYGLTR